MSCVILVQICSSHFATHLARCKFAGYFSHFLVSDTALCQVLNPTAAVDDYSFFLAYLTPVHLSLPCQWSVLLDCLKEGDRFSSSFLSLFEFLSHAVLVDTFCPPLFLILTECFSSSIFFTSFSSHCFKSVIAGFKPGYQCKD